MMLTSRDPNGPGSGRASRASNLSAMSRLSGRPASSAPDAGKQDLLSSAGPGVMSMLRTSTEMGNVAGELSGIGNLPRASQRRGASSRLSTASSLSNHSSHAYRQHRQWPSSSSAARHSATRETMPPMPNVPQYVPDTLSPTVMNLPGTSPLVPTRDRHRDSQRSLSITHAMPQPEFPLSNHRSMGSLRSHNSAPRPRSPFAYPTRLKRPGYRPVSPAWSETPGSRPRRLNAPASQGQMYTLDQRRLRVPSDGSLGHQERAIRPPRHFSRGPSPSSAHHQLSYSNMPPLPSAHHGYHHAVDRACRLNRSVRGSVSSSSTNMRTDSDTPSSDMPLPPTPRDNAPRGTVGGSFAQLRQKHALARTDTDNIASRPMYYDYSEQFEHEDLAQPEMYDVPAGFVRPDTTAIGDRQDAAALSQTDCASIIRETTQDEQCEVIGISELPASPVARRITRAMVQKALEPVSTTGDVVSSVTAPNAQGDVGSSDNQDTTSRPAYEETTTSSRLPIGTKNNRYSSLSHTGSSLIDSSTVEFAVRYSIPAMTGSASNGLMSSPLPALKTSASPGTTTEDGMSELLAGYQHTDSKQGDHISEQEREPEMASGLDERRSNHAQKSSDEQSFKSCTDVPELTTPHGDGDTALQQSRSEPAIVVPSSQPPQNLDARSFETCPNVNTPLHAGSSSANADMFPGAQATKAISSSPPLILSPLQVKSLPRESNFSTVATKLRSISKPSRKQDSISVSASSSTLSVIQQPPPPVPPRESSASKEAQRSNAVGSFLLRRVFTKEKKANRNDEATTGANLEQPVPQVVSTNSRDDALCLKQYPDAIKTPEKASHEQNTCDQQAVSESQSELCSPQESVSSGGAASLARYNTTPCSSQTKQPEPSSVYSSHDISSKSHSHSSSAGRPLSNGPIDAQRRDSQTTTHLAWAGCRPVLPVSATVSEPHLPLPSLQEDTTTDLRLSGYRYNFPQRYLPDLKEESHEDSSLNTSASNLKSSHFRFPQSVGPLARASVDEAAMFSRRASLRSHRRSVIGEAQGLPSLDFSQTNLLEKCNGALGGVRLSRSEGQLQLDIQAPAQDSPLRSVSVGEVREVVASPIEDPTQVEALGRVAPATGPTGCAQVKHGYSPEKLVAEIDQLSIPSVTGLTQRFTEMLPSLSLADGRPQVHGDQADEFPEEQEILEHAVVEIHHVHPPSQKRSTARLRPMKGKPELMIVDDDVYEEITKKDRGHAQVGGQGSGPRMRGVGEATAPTQNRLDNATHTPTPHFTFVPEFHAPPPAALRPRSHTAGNNVVRSSTESTLSTRRSLRSFASTPTATDTRPWNFDKNYPWATTTLPSVDISLPAPALARHSPRPGPSHLRNTLSDATTSTFTSARTPTTSPSGNVSSSHPSRQRQRLSIFGRTGDQAHAVGERYPTSALSPPTAIFRDHFSTCDTSDDEDFTTSRKTKVSLRKRFSSAARNTTLPHATPPHYPEQDQSSRVGISCLGS